MQGGNMLSVKTNLETSVAVARFQCAYLVEGRAVYIRCVRFVFRLASALVRINWCEGLERQPALNNCVESDRRTFYLPELAMDPTEKQFLIMA